VCLILAAWRVHPDFPLVIAANRDEFFARPTRSAGFWPESPDMLAGRDLSAGGTWLGITRNGRFAALTNYRDPQSHDPSAPSRGSLVTRFLEGKQSSQAYLAEVAGRGARFNGFNLLVCDGRELACYNNVEHRTEILEPGIHGLSNHVMNTSWPKVTTAKKQMQDALKQLPDSEGLFRFLSDDSIAADEVLPATGVSLELERRLSAIFVRGPAYGTRNSTVLLAASDGHIVFDEQEWKENGSSGNRQRFSFHGSGH
jgi:uncharacterized protein with NRDE domain